MPKDTAMTDSTSFGFLLLPGFSMMSLSALLEPLRMANKISLQPLYHWQTFTMNNQPVSANNNLLLPPSDDTDPSGEWIQNLDNLILVAGDNIHQHYSPFLRSLLRRCHQRRIRLGATSTASFLLAYAGIIGQRPCTVHWEYLDAFRAEFPQVQLTRSLFEITPLIMTCSGGLAGLDMLLAIIAEQQGETLSNSIADQYMHSQIRSGDSAQRNTLTQRYQIHNPKILVAIQAMEEHLEAPLNLSDIVRLASISARQLQRLFRQQFSCSVMEFYLKLRLQRAKSLLQETDISIANIALICGFGTSAYFSRRYRELFTLTPRDSRRLSHGQQSFNQTNPCKKCNK